MTSLTYEDLRRRGQQPAATDADDGGGWRENTGTKTREKTRGQTGRFVRAGPRQRRNADRPVRQAEACPTSLLLLLLIPELAREHAAAEGAVVEAYELMPILPEDQEVLRVD